MRDQWRAVREIINHPDRPRDGLWIALALLLIAAAFTGVVVLASLPPASAA